VSTTPSIKRSLPAVPFTPTSAFRPSPYAHGVGDSDDPKDAGVLQPLDAITDDALRDTDLICDPAVGAAAIDLGGPR
jgi:hypothetical protein